jgi:hypothetical protein
MPYLYPHAAPVPRHVQPDASAQPMTPSERLRRFGPIRPMASRPSLIERILFG